MKTLFKSALPFMAVLGLLVCSQLSVAGQSEKSGIDGVWQTVVTPRICATGAPVGITFPGILLFQKGGTMTGTSTAAASVYGLWDRESGARRYSFATLSFKYDAGGVLIGSRRIAQEVTLDQSGDTFVSSGGFQDFDPAGNPT
ncbi:MAG: hypothetical protein ABJB34_10900, partial [Acidobacteriota bacterium]